MTVKLTFVFPTTIVRGKYPGSLRDFAKILCLRTKTYDSLAAAVIAFPAISSASQLSVPAE